MRRSFAIGFTAKRFVNRSLVEKVNPATVYPSFSFCWRRDFSGLSDDKRELLRNGLSYIKLEDAVALFKEMVKSRPYPSIIEFSKLMSTIAKMKKYDLVISMGEQMQNLGVSHNDYTYNILVNSFCCSSQLSLALAILGKMMKFGYETSFVTLNPLLIGYCHGKMISEAVALVDQMVKMGYQPNTVTITNLIRGLYLTNKASEALAFVDRMMLNGHSVVISDQLHRALKKQVASLEYHTIGQSFNFQAALQDLSQPNAEASLPDGVLTVPLLKHQRIALSWMAQRETTGLPCSGGFLADDQGLGKTVSIIALILKERSKSAQACEESIKKEFFDLESENGASDHSQLPFNENIVGGDSVGKARGKPAAGTLVVCPTSVMRQWADELHKKVTSESNLSVLVYHGSSRTKDPHELAKYDVVVTTYSIVSMEVPKQPLVDDEDKEKSGVHDGSKKMGSKKKKDVEVLPGPLAKVSWCRVVLDEAQIIKNYKTQVARACWGLCAERRWCLSGTPIQNSIDDLYSYFRFLKYAPYSSYVCFCKMIKNPISMDPVKGYQKLQVILKTVMLRRTKGSLLDGKPVISLPPKSIELRKVDFTAEERDFYSKLEADFCSQFQEYAAGTVKEDYVKFLSMLSRLRQACNHPLLVNGKYSFTWGSSVGLAKKQICSEASLAICGICNDAPEDAVVSSVCGHVFCKQCIYERLIGDNNNCPLANCNAGFTFSSLSYEARLDDATPGNHDCVTSDHVESFGPCSGEDLPYVSSKIKAALEILQSLAKPQYLTDTKHISQNIEDSSLPVTPVEKEGSNLDVQIKVAGEKAIVFSQWTKMLDLLQASLVSSGIQFRRLDGTMSVADRDKAVQDFNTHPEVSVMIMSLKAASLGLNMVAACHVLMLDLWWNPTTEDQAIDRAHRIGQTRPVKVVRFTVKDTVEDRILALQEKKRMMVASAFGEDEKGSRQSQLTVEELSYLFMGDS